VLGITFKENCPDIRNSKVIDVIRELQSYGIDVEVYDPQADKEEVFHEYGQSLIDQPSDNYDGIILAVSHDEFKKMSPREIGNPDAVVFDIKGFWNKKEVDCRL
jgi:UDP-N-acetyl-D-glucosamine/UDP-N-acetyl-D-galactosamine dehydrogenase